MRLYAYLLFALCVLRARAATIPQNISPELEKKITDIIAEVPKAPQENVSSEQELIDQANSVKDVENNLRNSAKIAGDIPVTVVIEDAQPDLKIGGERESVNEIGSDEEYVKRPEVDLKNPGPPQRQEHETQNPEYFEDSRRTVTNVKQNIQDTQILLKQGFQGVTDDIQQWFQNNEQINEIQKSIKNLQNTFTNQLTKIRESIQTVSTAQHTKPVQSEATQTQKNNLRNIESQLSTLETNFNTGLQTLSDGVKIVATLRADSESAASSETSSTAPEVKPPPAVGNPPAPVSPQTPTNPILEYIQKSLSELLAMLSERLGNITQLVSQQPAADQNGSTTPAGAQADDAAATTQRPFWSVPNPSQLFNNFFNQQQNQSSGTQAVPASVQQTLAAQPLAPPTGPFGQITQTFQDSQLGQGIIALLQPITQTFTQAPAAAPVSPVQTVNSVPAPIPTAAPQPVTPAQLPSSGPIRQIVQRIQTSINNPEKPRDSDIKEDEKGILLIPIKGHGGGHGGGSGDNNDGGELADKIEHVDEVKEESITEEKKKDEIKPEAVVDKTE